MSATVSKLPVPARKATTEQMLREALAELDMARALERDTLRRIDALRRRWRQERPGTFLLPSIDQLRREVSE